MSRDDELHEDPESGERWMGDRHEPGRRGALRRLAKVLGGVTALAVLGVVALSIIAIVILLT
jgi:hypothetical protein